MSRERRLIAALVAELVHFETKRADPGRLPHRALAVPNESLGACRRGVGVEPERCGPACQQFTRVLAEARAYLVATESRQFGLLEAAG
mgnify:CR=1 FL=1